MGRRVGRVVLDAERREEIRDMGRRGRLMNAVHGQFEGSSVNSISNILVIGLSTRLDWIWMADVLFADILPDCPSAVASQHDVHTYVLH